MLSSDPPNPKLRPEDQKGRARWYPFYAGFSSKFATWAIESNRASLELGSLLDPWNGSGASTAIAAERSYSAYGLDLNPAMIIVAKARLLDPLDVSSLAPLKNEILAKARQGNERASEDSLELIFGERTSNSVRNIEAAIYGLLVNSDAADSSALPRDMENASPIAAFFYVALFRTVRRLLQMRRTSNPVWIRLASKSKRRGSTSLERVHAAFSDEISTMIALEPTGRPAPHASSNRIHLINGSSTNIPIPDRTVGLVLTSPPYCTRLDYAVATLPELLTLGFNYKTTFRDLRTQLIGTTTVPKDQIEPSKDWGPTTTSFLEKLYAHPSKASSSYYYKNHCSYFESMFTSVGELARKLVDGGRAIFVVQDSHYKEIHNDVPTSLQEMCQAHGLHNEAKRDFPLTHLLAGCNPHTRRYRPTVAATESVIVVRKSSV